MEPGALNARLITTKARVRRLLDDLDNEEVRTARSLAAHLRSGRGEVIQLGNSVSEWIAPGDADRRQLHTMVADGLARPDRTYSVHGGSYGPRLHKAAVEFAMRVGRPQLFVVQLWYRGQFRPWVEHPVFGRARATQAIAELPGDLPLRRIRRRFPRPTAADWERYHSLPWDTFAGLGTVGEHVRLLKDPAFIAHQPQERAKLLYAYHLSHRLDPADGELGDLQQLGRTLAATGVPVVVYEAPVPVERGVELWGEGFRRVAAANFALLTEHFRRGYGSTVPVIASGLDVPGQEFIDLDLADEHLNERGRRRLAGDILAGIADVRPDLVARGSRTLAIH